MIREKAGGRMQITVGILISSLIIIAASVGCLMLMNTFAASDDGVSDEDSAFKSYC